ncbi:MAG TPA: L,D-transpeptidase family protein [Chthoniobacteraceae bacterium]|nr:L,D-transpeptidase family protein [Chthoniobacteraceae bacterium]
MKISLFYGLAAFGLTLSVGVAQETNPNAYRAEIGGVVVEAAPQPSATPWPDRTVEPVDSYSTELPGGNPSVVAPTLSPSVTAPPTVDGFAVPVEAPVVPVTELPVARAEPVNTLEITARIQIFLDQKRFGPGKIDGTPGEFTSKALARYQAANGLPVTGDLADAGNLPLDDIHPIYTTYTITAEDVKRVGPIPGKPEEQAKLKRMPYPTLLKFVQERFHSDPDFLRYLNSGMNLDQLTAGDVIRVPNVKPFKIEEVKEVAKTPVDRALLSRRIVVDTREKILDLFEGNTLLASFPITPGSSKIPAPPGNWKVLGITTLPWYRYDEGVLKRGVRTNTFYNIPAGPSSPVGVVWMGINRPGIGLHGTNNPQTIGRAASAGCIRLANWDAIRLAKMITPGVSVTIDADLIPQKSAATAKVSQTD